MSEQQRFPWPAASATGVGSCPGDDPDEMARTVFGELPELPHLPELPERGAGADLVGRGAALLVEFPVEVQPSGWRVVQRPGRDLTRAADFLSYDLDALEDRAHAYTGPLKVQVAGPWTLAASIELRGGERLVADPGAIADLCESQLEGVRGHLADLRARVPGAQLLVQVDEPSLPSVLTGRVPTASGYGTLRAVERVAVEERLRALFGAIDAAGALPMVHCCAEAVPIDLLRRCGARAVSLDATLLTRAADEAIGTAVEAGIGIFAGVVPGSDAVLSAPAANVDPVREMWHRIGFDPEHLAGTVVITPRCGLAGASAAYVREALAACRAAARVLRDEPRR
ncbi:methionine synthase [Murinocardiopsis flavida]|uniref:methionine synthase n=1 Tax=Murinocardiopsis flavida TaxID=645275 RepID=UPI000D0D44D4|nr:methionine synthase [Murinocardiopsis flavida]